MAIVYETGSLGSSDLKTATIENSTLNGAADSFSAEMNSLLSSGYEVIGNVFWDGTSYVAVFKQKRWN